MSKELPEIAIVGLGRWGLNYVREWSRCAAVRIGALVDGDRDALARASSLAPSAALFSSMEDVLSLELDGIVIATPSPTHAALALRALSTGVHVLVEKPLATSVADALRVARGDTSKRRVLVGHITTHHPVTRWLEQTVASGGIGAVVSVTATRTSAGAARSNEPALWALGPHDVSSAVRLVGVPATRARAQYSDTKQQGAELDVVFHDGAIAHLTFARTGKSERSLEVRGALGAARVDEANGRAWLERDGEWVEQHPTGEASPLTAQCRHFVECIRDGASPRSDVEEGLAVVEILAAAQASASSGGGWSSDLRAHQAGQRPPESLALP